MSVTEDVVQWASKLILPTVLDQCDQFKSQELFLYGGHKSYLYLLVSLYLSKFTEYPKDIGVDLTGGWYHPDNTLQIIQEIWLFSLVKWNSTSPFTECCTKKELSQRKWNFLYLLRATKAELNIFYAAILDLHVSYIIKYFLLYPLELHMASMILLYTMFW